MPRAGKPRNEKGKTASSNGANLGFEAKLWLAADKLRNNMDAAEYKHVVLGLIFLKYISDTFKEVRAKLAAGVGDYAGANPEDADEYRAENTFWVPKEARWPHLQANAKQPTIGKTIDDAMVAIERDNPRLKGVLPKDYARPALDKHRLGELIDLIGTIGLGDRENRSKDILGRVYEYFLTQFASAEGKNGGQFYTPNCVVRVLVEMLSPYKGRVYDPCCGSGGMFVQSEKFVEAHGGVQSRRNLVQSQLFSEKLQKTLNAYHNRAIVTQEVIEELIALAKEMDAASKRGDDLGLSEDEIAFYDALAANDNARQVMGDQQLKVIATELITKVRSSVTIDWQYREGARARIRVLIKRILNKYGYPPDLQDAAVQTVLKQAELLCADWGVSESAPMR